MTEKETYFIKIWDTENPDVYGVGECAIFRGLSSDDTPDYELKLRQLCNDINKVSLAEIKESSLRFGFETAMADLRNGGRHEIFSPDWLNGNRGIEINGLVWMSNFATMRQRLHQKIADGFRCIKIKIGAIDFREERELIGSIRSDFSSSEVEIRLDANGAFSPKDALNKIDMLAKYDIHSIEQPICAGQWQAMREICKQSPIPIALDEELIGNIGYDMRCRLLDSIMPAYIILKPSLCGGFSTADGWIKDATEREINWWSTSALESNIGLNAIAQWAASKQPSVPQGLGTGMLYSNNIPSPIYIYESRLYYNPEKNWDLTAIRWTN